jgi:hypothetical protein
MASSASSVLPLAAGAAAGAGAGAGAAGAAGAGAAGAAGTTPSGLVAQVAPPKPPVRTSQSPQVSPAQPKVPAQTGSMAGGPFPSVAASPRGAGVQTQQPYQLPEQKRPPTDQSIPTSAVADAVPNVVTSPSGAAVLSPAAEHKEEKQEFNTHALIANAK